MKDIRNTLFQEITLSPVEKEGRNHPGVCVVGVGVTRRKSFPGRGNDMCEDPKIRRKKCSRD